MHSVAKIANTETITAAALVTTPAVSAMPRSTASRVGQPALDVLADPAQHEHVVVHRQPDQHHQHEQRDPVDHEARAGEVERARRTSRAGRPASAPRTRRPTETRLSTVETSAIGTLRKASPIISMVSSSTNPITIGRSVAQLRRRSRGTRRRRRRRRAPRRRSSERGRARGRRAACSIASSTRGSDSSYGIAEVQHRASCRRRRSRPASAPVATKSPVATARALEARPARPRPAPASPPSAFTTTVGRGALASGNAVGRCPGRSAPPGSTSGSVSRLAEWIFMPSAGTASATTTTPPTHRARPRGGARPAPSTRRLMPPRPIRRLSRHSSGHPRPVDPATELDQQRRQHGDRAEHGDRDDEDRRRWPAS